MHLFSLKTLCGEFFSKILVLDPLTSFSKDPHGGERGDATLMVLLLVFTLGLFMTLSFKKLSLAHLENRQRKATYLCLKETMDSFVSLQGFIRRTNLAIISINALLVANPTPYLHKLKKLVQMIQNKKTITSVYKTLQTSTCSGLQKLFVKKVFPLKRTGLKLQRTFFGTVSEKKTTSSFFLPSRSSPPFFFFIKGKVHFSPQLQISRTTEFPLSLYQRR